MRVSASKSHFFLPVLWDCSAGGICYPQGKEQANHCTAPCTAALCGLCCEVVRGSSTLGGQKAELLSGHGHCTASAGSLVGLALCFLSVSFGLKINLLTLANLMGNVRAPGNSCFQGGMQ